MTKSHVISSLEMPCDDITMWQLVLMSNQTMALLMLDYVPVISTTLPSNGPLGGELPILGETCTVFSGKTAELMPDEAVLV